jgi:hypothetical protein
LEFYTGLNEHEIPRISTTHTNKGNHIFATVFMYCPSRRRLQLPRYFTGALFPECIADKIIALEAKAELSHQQVVGQHPRGSHSGGLWVPRRLLMNGAFGPGITAAPGARLIDAAALFPPEAAKLTELLGLDTTMISAEQTTSPTWFYEYLQYLGDGRYVAPTSPQTGPADSDVSTDEPPQANGDGSTSNTRVYIPHTATGGLHRPKLEGKLTAVALQRQFESPWWIPATWVNRRNTMWTLATPGDAPAFKHEGVGWYNVDQTIHPGSCCAITAAHRCYEPHTIFGGQFPRSLEQQMQRTALQCGWNRRLWLTLDEASKIDGVSLKDGEQSNLMTSLMNRDGLMPSVYFCASQFHDPTGALPLLRDLQLLGSGAVFRDGGKYQKLFDPLFGTRSPEEWEKSVGRIARGPQPIANTIMETERVGAVVIKPLHQHSALRHLHARQYLKHSESKRMGDALPLRPTAQGRCVHGRHIAMKDAIYFNAEDYEFPVIAASLVSQHPVHLLTYQRFFGPIQLKMMERMAKNMVEPSTGGGASISPQQRQATSKLWVPVDFLAAHGLAVPDLSTTFHVNHSTDTAYLPNRPWQGDLGNSSTPTRTFVYLPDVHDPSGRLQQVASYLPRKLDGTYFTGIARSSILQCAVAHDLLTKDPRWVSGGLLQALKIDVNEASHMSVSVESRGGAWDRSQSDAECVARLDGSGGDSNAAASVAVAGRTHYYPLSLFPQQAQDEMVAAVKASMDMPVQTKYNKMGVPRHQRVTLSAFIEGGSSGVESDVSTDSGKSCDHDAALAVARQIYQTPLDASVL